MSASSSKPVAIVVGLGGVTNGGKTTMCRALEKFFSSESKHLRLKTFHLDDYFRLIDDPQHIYLTEYKTQDWDCLSALDLDRFVSDLKSDRDRYDLILVEGFLIFNIPSESLYDLSYFFDLPYDECCRRRSERVYEPPDPEGYFQGHVWLAYLKAKKDAVEQMKTASFTLVDTTEESFETIQKNIIDGIENLLSKKTLSSH